MKPSISIVTPIYNDLPTMVTVLPKLEALAKAHFDRWEIVLLDDASCDDSWRWAKGYSRGKKRIRLYRHANNMGIARTYRELYRRARYDVIVLFSLDGEWDPFDAIRLAVRLTERKFDIVVGIRRKKVYTLWRAVVSYVYNIVTRLVFRVAMGDAGSIKALRRQVVRETPIISSGVFDEAERLIRAKKAGYSIGFIHVHHKRTNKIHRGIRLFQVLEATRDCLRVFISLRRTT